MTNIEPPTLGDRVQLIDRPECVFVIDRAEHLLIGNFRRWVVGGKTDEGTEIEALLDDVEHAS